MIIIGKQCRCQRVTSKATIPAAIKGEIDRCVLVDSYECALGFGVRAAGCGGTRYHYFDPPALLRDGVAAFSAAVSRRQLVL